ncbi:hypothetical protein D3C76_1123880 [compost metagenome]
MARVVGTVQHRLDHRPHAVERGDFRAGAISVCPYADAYVQPLVTVDDVVTAATFDEVAAAATEDDVAAVVERRADRQQTRQTVDQADVGQHTAGCTQSG